MELRPKVWLIPYAIAYIYLAFALNFIELIILFCLVLSIIGGTRSIIMLMEEEEAGAK